MVHSQIAWNATTRPISLYVTTRSKVNRQSNPKNVQERVSYQNSVLHQILLERNKGAYLSATAVMRNQWLSRDSVYGNVKYVFEVSCVAVPYNQ